jgi:mono/diheme cytochrome c family protein
MRRPAAIVQHVALAAALTVGAVSVVSAVDANYLPPEALATADGAAIYAHICQGCHMPEAQGAAGAGHYPKLSGDPKLVAWEYAAVTVLGGRNGMPGFGLPPNPGAAGPFGAVHLSDEQVAAVVNYVRGHFGNKYKPTVTASQVAKLPHPGTEPGLD